MLNLPNSNDLEQINGIYRTGLARFRPRNYGWRRLQEALNRPFCARLQLNLPSVYPHRHRPCGSHRVISFPHTTGHAAFYCPPSSEFVAGLRLAED